MAILRAQAEGILVRRVGALLTAAGLDGTTVDGKNPDLNDPLLTGLLRLGHTSVVDVAKVTNTDLQAITSGELDPFLDLAEFRALESVVGNLDDVDIRIGPRREDKSQLGEQVERKMRRLEKKIADIHGIGAGSLDMGVIDLDFAAKGDDTIISES